MVSIFLAISIDKVADIAPELVHLRPHFGRWEFRGDQIIGVICLHPTQPMKQLTVNYRFGAVHQLLVDKNPNHEWARRRIDTLVRLLLKCLAREATKARQEFEQKRETLNWRYQERKEQSRLLSEEGRKWAEERRRERDERDRRWRKREQAEREARHRRKEEAKREKAEKAAQEQRESAIEKEFREAAEARRNRPSVDWRQSLSEMRQKRLPTPTERIAKLRFDMELACSVSGAWETSFPSRPLCPMVAAWRHRAIAQFNEWSKSRSRREKNVPWSKSSSANSPWSEPHNFRFSRRPTLSQYDNRRDGVIRDRYRFGIYAGQYDD